MKNVRPVRSGTGLTRFENEWPLPLRRGATAERCYVASAPLRTPISPAPSTRLRPTSVVRVRSTVELMDAGYAGQSCRARVSRGYAERSMHPVNFGLFRSCLLYTSDAADERSSVDLGGRRIIKKKKHSG